MRFQSRHNAKMILLWVILLALHRVYSLVPVITVHLGEPVTFSCTLPHVGISSRQLSWYKQSAGDTLKLIVTQKKFAQPEYAPEFSESRFKVNDDKNNFNLTIVRATQEDEGLYHCAITEWISAPVWSGTYLILKGNSQRTSNYTVVQRPTASDPGDSVALQCSVLSDSDNKTCPEDHSVYWFRAGADKSHTGIIYTDGNKLDKCDKRSDSVKSCFYHLSKNVSSSDAGTYYCAVATCGEIIFGHGTKLLPNTRGQTASSEFIGLVILIVCLAISVIGNIVFICCRTPRAGREGASSEGRHNNLSQPIHDRTEGGHDLNYAALHFSGGKVTRGRMKKRLKTEESVYAQVNYEM
ncbi:signal-regulatory protein beta-2-like [Trachinotus anak]|uniref:signal-regulatory protein beta-2-like n=1 Tax=Trachinotus anak TaxID=443729 RepID=UPI0039F1B1FA